MPEVTFNIGDKVKRLRTERNLALKDVAAGTGFSTALISRIEHNLVSPPIATLYRISQALNVRVRDFFEEEPPREELHVLRASDRARAYRDGSRYGYRYESLATDDEHGNFEPLLVTLDPEHKNRPHVFGHKGHEFIFILKGRMRLHYGSKTVILGPGDSTYFSAQVAHGGTCHGRSPVTALSIRLTGPEKAS